MKLLTYRDLMHHYWGHIFDMCKHTKLQGREWECVRFETEKLEDHPTFISPPEYYEFAVGIVEDRPVFPGDRLWEPGKPLIVDEYTDLFHLTWIPPSQEECIQNLPAPVGKSEGLILIMSGEEQFYVRTYKDYEQWRAYFASLLIAARDKGSQK